jgi:4a-hydroxytetrahydrobiopterin dehydratase
MVKRITAQQFQAAPGVEDWRVLPEGARTYFATGSFSKGVELIQRIGELADAANHHPDVDLRYPGVTVTLTTHEVSDISERDAALAAQISAAARELGIPADPSRAARSS